ncbi:MAG TPA: POTRA domain-containing protein, partial [Rubricoccaceae bacterium]|nr:POTRA domain-containing protein [Rubricoccaceae bacterium]
MPAAPRLVVLPVLRFALPLGVLAGLFVVTAHPAMAQPEAPRYEVLAVNVEGASEDMAPYALQASGLRVGQRVALPYDAAFSEAVRDLYALGQFSDVEVVADRVAGEGVFLLIRVVEEPRLADYRLEGVSGSAREDLEPQIPLMRGRPVRPSDIERTVLGIQEYYRKKGYLRPTVEVERATNAEGRVELTFDVTRGPRLEVIDVRFTGNEAFSERTLRRRLKNTPERRWWRFWSAETFVEEELDEDLQRVVEFYNNRGYYGARVVRDTAYVVDPPDGRAGVVVEVAVEEGPRYRVRHVDFEGNTLFTDEQLRQALGFQRGDVYDASKLDQNLYYTEQHTDVASLYTDRGYLRFEIRPVITEVPGDSLDLLFEIVEGDVYEFGQVEIAGNTRTKDHVIRRELRTVPGQTYSRQAIERSVRELITLNYFDQTSLAAGPDIAVDDEDKTVDLGYTLTEASSDQLELSGG